MRSIGEIPRIVIQLANGYVCELGVDEWLLSAVMSMCVDARSVFRQFMVIVKFLMLGLVCIRVQV